MGSVPQKIIEEIGRRLEAIETAEGVTILYACESGSRAWGFASADSDFDVRFIYIRPQDWYLSIDVESRRDVIERPVDGVWDVNGWDLRKALRLLRKSNPPLLEWLDSPIVYRAHPELAAGLRKLASGYYSPSACRYHYLHMARVNFRGYLQGELVRTKKYFYVLRPLLAMRWIEQSEEMVPMRFDHLLDATVDDRRLRRAIDTLLEEKKAGVELDSGPRIPEISGFIEAELARHEASGVVRRKPATDLESLNDFFRRALTVNEGGD